MLVSTKQLYAQYSYKWRVVMLKKYYFKNTSLKTLEAI